MGGWSGELGTYGVRMSSGRVECMVLGWIYIGVHSTAHHVQRMIDMLRAVYGFRSEQNSSDE